MVIIILIKNLFLGDIENTKKINNRNNNNN